MKTARIAEPISGEKLYQQRARRVLPILVRQAEAATPITYSSLADEVDIPNPRNLNYVLGSIGTTLENLSKAWKIKVPPIQCLVVNKNTGLPGEGIAWFLIKKEDFSTLDKRRKEDVVNGELQHIYAFKEWKKVLAFLGLPSIDANYSKEVEKAAKFRGGGESEKHKKLKEYVSLNPESVNLPYYAPKGAIEYGLSSGDTVDVFFNFKPDWIAVEVKSSISSEADIVRGLFQCVKYKAVLEAMQLASKLPQNARAILALESELPKKLLPLKNLLGVEVVESVYENNYSAQGRT